MKKNKFLIGPALVLVASIILHFYGLDWRAIHHDEGMLAHFAWQFTDKWDYIYTPQIHGPILFYVQGFIFKFMGLGDDVLRFSMALFGVLLTAVPLIFRKQLGPKALPLSVAFLISPLMLYYSRFLVHTGIAVVFWLVFILSLIQFFSTFKKKWLYAMTVALAFAFGTSETTYIICAGLVPFPLVMYLLNKKAYKAKVKKIREFISEDYDHILNAIIIFLLLWFAIYSVGFTNIESLKISIPNPFDSRSSLGFWMSQHKVRLGGQPWFYYLVLLAVYEPFFLVASLTGLIKTISQRKTQNLFLAWWMITALAGFSIAGEKFPWLFLPSLLPIIVFSIFYLVNSWKSFSRYVKIIFIILAVINAIIAYRLNFINYNEPREMAVYVQTPYQYKDFAKKAQEDCANSDNQCILIDKELSWPNSWYFENISSLVDPKNFSVSEKTKYIISDFKSTELSSSAGFQREVYRLRSWWVPEKCRNISCLSNYYKYFIYRNIWNEEGGYDVYILSR